MHSPTPCNALQAGTIFVMTHDSIGLGEDGPTHQPVEHLASFRAMPNILMMRPGDGNETAGCYKVGYNSSNRSLHCIFMYIFLLDFSLHTEHDCTSTSPLFAATVGIKCDAAGVFQV